MPTRLELHPDHVVAAAEQSLRRGLRVFGQAVADDARQSLEQRSRPSRPGETPSVWSAALQQISATIDERENGVVIAPDPQTNRQGGGSLPALLEGGGTRWDGAIIAPRPFMGPAFQRQLARHVPGIWRDQLRG